MSLENLLQVPGGDGKSFVSTDSGISEEKKPPLDVLPLEPLPSHLQCPACRQVLRLPKRLPCDHLLCTPCANAEIACPECGQSFDPAQLPLDKGVAREVQALQVRCSYAENGCPWTGPLSALQDHALNCEHAVLRCPRGCGATYGQDEESKHLLSDCPNRPVDCEFCGHAVTLGSLQTHLRVCPEATADCPNGCGLVGVKRAQLEAHLPECPKSGTICPFGVFGCRFEGDRPLLQKHMKKEVVSHLSLLADSVLVLREALSTAHLNTEHLVTLVNRYESEFRSIERLYTGQFVWRIEDMQNKSRKDAVIYSQPFATGRNGYKLVVSAVLNGANNFVGVFITIMKSQYDALLTWPFIHKITFTLLDQNPDINARRHHSYILKPYASVENKTFLDRPKTESNEPFGVPNFLPITELKRFVDNNIAFLKVDVDTESMVVL